MDAVSPQPAAQPAPHSRGDAPAVDSARMHSKVAWRLIPFLIFLFLLAWIDRVNVGFAKLQMLQDLRFSEAVYGLGAGIFFIGYFLFEVPSNLLLQRIGARKTLARITILWADVDGHGLRHDAVLVLPAALPAGRVRGGLLSRRHAVPDVLDPRRPAASTAGS